MGYKEIVQQLNAQLTGNYEVDIPFLQMKGEQYKSHEQAREILRAITGMIYDVLPEHMKAQLTQQVYSEEQEVQKKLEQAIHQLAERECEQAKQTIEAVIEIINSRHGEEKQGEYFSFHSMLESLLYQEYFKPEHKVHQTTHDNSLIYRVYGCILAAMKQMDQAVQAFENSLRWNPLDVETLFELGEVYKQIEELDKFRDLSLQSLKYATSGGDLARSYRNLGYYYVDEEDYETAISLYFLSNSYEPNQMASSELQFIAQKLDKELTKPDMKQVAAALEAHNIAIGADETVIGIALALAQRAKERKDIAAAKHHYSLVYELTGDPAVQAELKQL